MDVEYEAVYHRAEARHWWFLARRAFILLLLRRLRLPKSAVILDVGCSAGFLLEQLVGRYNQVYGVDVSERAVVQARERSGATVQVADGIATGFAEGMFDCVVASDVLEHIEDDRAALDEWRRVLKPDGYLLVFVPAFQWLWSAHDEVNHHYRRYTKRSLQAAVERVGFKVKQGSYWNGLLFPLVVFGRLRQLWWKKTAPFHYLVIPPRLVNAILILILRLEGWLLKKFSLFMGSSVFVVCRKR